MQFTLATWKHAFAERLPQWRQRMQQAGIPSLYAAVSAMALWPVVAAVQENNLAAAMALGSVVGSVGSNLLANHLQRWKDEADMARQLPAAVQAEPGLQAELDVVLDRLDALSQARQALPENERLWFDDTLRDELQRQGRGSRFVAHLSGSGAIAQGENAMAAGQGGVVIRGAVQDNIISGAQRRPVPATERRPS